ncbi:hypothetical protein MCHIJ_41850 [Mycolicibacterium chitae]|nr:hypothetical protein MCHIJ_41850 [Mycolicibacterium chitae]
MNEAINVIVVLTVPIECAEIPSTAADIPAQPTAAAHQRSNVETGRSGATRIIGRTDGRSP